MKSPGKLSAPSACAYCDLIVDYLREELAPEVRERFEAHLAGCPGCRQESDATHRLLGELACAPEAAVSHDLAPEILARVAATVRPSRPLILRWQVMTGLAAAAAVVLLLGGALWLRARAVGPGVPGGVNTAGAPSAGAPAASPPDDGATREAVAWLCRTQEPDGSWSTARWGGHAQFEVALTGLSLLALLDSESAAPADARQVAVQRAIEYLVKHQDDSGAYGAAFDSAPYNQGIATLALLRAWQRLKGAEVKRSADRAVELICARQCRDGGWGLYLNEATPASNLSISLWQIEALRLAVSLGWEGARPNVGKGFRWIANRADDQGFFGYRQAGDFPSGPQTLTAMGAMSLLDAAHGNLVSAARRQAIKVNLEQLAASPGPDVDYYRSYFLAAALRKMGEESSLTRLKAIRHDLAGRQVHEGPHSGSWNGDDCWSGTGGRVYATAMASLTLR